MTLGNGNNLCNFSCDHIIIKNSLSEKILGLTIYNNLDFSDHISDICRTDKCFIQSISYINSDKCTLLINYFINSHFSYCPLIWMF